MATGYINNRIGYYVGDKISSDDIDVPLQPSQYHEYINGSWVISINLSINAFESAIQYYLDSYAQSKGYDNITTACSYAAAPNPFQAEAISFVTWRGNVWHYCYGELAKVQSGTRPMPTIEQIISELPVRV